uniref:Uncharacterized protein n=2 Tax=Guillardia theta TaxID=55529 RepID=A0A7S4PEI8_GUITH|mmetsp:Transcript_4857/g.17622  ORF Transcript_4857/g.17622 Transcript_4857/m.17622 type:complete len:1594 (+) Transcript_4857:560-5341(+)
MWLRGQGSPQQDAKKAAAWLKKAANEGHAEASYQLGVLALTRYKSRRETESAWKWMIQAALLGHREAQFRLGWRFETESAAHVKAQDARDEAGEAAEDVGEGGLLMAKAMGWYLKAARQEHALSQHKVAVMYSQGIKPVDPVEVDRRLRWHLLPSVITWACSQSTAMRTKQAKVFHHMPSVVSWLVPSHSKMKFPNYSEAASWHQRAALNGIYESAYELGRLNHMGIGMKKDANDALKYYLLAARGHDSSAEGSTVFTQYLCPNCGCWNENKYSRNVSKGDIVCKQCRKPRTLPDEVSVVASRLLESVEARDNLSTHRSKTREGLGSRGVMMSRGSQRQVQSQHLSISRDPYDALRTVGGGSVTSLQAPEVDVGRRGTPKEKAMHAVLVAQPSERAIMRVTDVELHCSPRLLHVLHPVGPFLKCKVTNESRFDSGSFYVEPYLYSSRDQAGDKSAKLLYGGRVFVHNMPARSSIIVSFDEDATCPLDLPPGPNHLSICLRMCCEDFLKAVGESVQELEKSMHEQSEVASLQVADALWHGVNFAQNRHEAIRIYRTCGGINLKHPQLLDRKDVVVVVMECGPLPFYFSPVAKSLGYKQAWLALSQLLDENMDKFPSNYLKDQFHLTPSLADDFRNIPAPITHVAAQDMRLLEAQLNLGMWYVQGRYLPKLSHLSLRWCQEAAARGSAKAKHFLGLLYQEGEVVGRDEALAVSYFLEAIRDGSLEAHVSLGICFLEGRGVEGDMQEAFSYLSFAAERGSAIAQFRLGAIHSQRSSRFYDPEESIRWFKAAAENGHRQAQLSYAIALLSGMNVKKNMALAVEMLERSAEQGYAVAEYNLGVLCARGEGVALDAEKAAAYWKRAAAQGLPEAQLELANYYMKVATTDEDKLEELRSRRIRSLCKDRTLFEKIVKLEKIELGYGGKSLMSMNFSLFYKVLQEYAAIIPSLISKESAAALVKKIQRVRGEMEMKAMSYELFLVYLTAVLRKVGVGVRNMFANVYETESMESIMSSQESEEDIQEEHDETSFQLKEELETSQLLRYVRTGVMQKATSPIEMSRSMRMSRSRVVKLKQEVHAARKALKFQKWKIDNAVASMDRLRAEADELKARMQAESAKKKMEMASNIKQSMDRLKRSEESAERSLLVAQERLHQETEALGKSEVKLSHSSKGRKEARRRMSSFRQKYSERVFELREQLEDAAATRLEYSVAAAELYLEAAKHDSMVAAQYLLGKYFEGRDPLPPSWVPRTEHDLTQELLADFVKYSRAFNHKMHRTNVVSSVKSFLESSSESLLACPPGSLGAKDKTSKLKAAERLAFPSWVHGRWRKLSALSWFERASAKEHAGAKVEMALVLKRLKLSPSLAASFTKDPCSSVEALLRQAADQGDVGALLELGRSFLHGDGVEQREEEAVRWLTAAAQGGSVEGWFLLGMCYELGRGTECDGEKAFECYERSADGGWSSALIALGSCYEFGKGVMRSEAEAFRLYEEAADVNVRAIAQLARCYQDGVGVEKNLTKAVELNMIAADADVKANVNLGIAYQYGIGVPRSDEEAFLWFERAAEQGDADGMMNVALCYSSGRGVKEDAAKCVMQSLVTDT